MASSETLKIYQIPIRQLRGGNVLDATEDILNTSGVLSLPAPQHFFDGLALQVVLRTAQIAGDDGEFSNRGIALDIALGTISEWSDHDMLLIVTQQLWRHCFEGAAIKHIEK